MIIPWGSALYTPLFQRSTAATLRVVAKRLLIHAEPVAPAGVFVEVALLVALIEVIGEHRRICRLKVVGVV